MSMIQINWNPTPTDLRKFGRAMLIGFGIISALFYHYNNLPLAKGCFAFGIIAGTLGLTGKRIALILYLPWMAIAFGLGNTTSRILLIILYYTLFTCIGTARKIIGVDRLNRKKKNATTYWKKMMPTSQNHDYEKQF